MNTIPQQLRFSQTIAHHLGLTYLQYENLREYYFAKWCLNFANTHHRAFNQLILNDCLMNWYQAQWRSVVEDTLRRHYGDCLHLYTPDDLLLLINGYAANLLPYYPKALLTVKSEQRSEIFRRLLTLNTSANEDRT